MCFSCDANSNNVETTRPDDRVLMRIPYASPTVSGSPTRTRESVEWARIMIRERNVRVVCAKAKVIRCKKKASKQTLSQLKILRRASKSKSKSKSLENQRNDQCQIGFFSPNRAGRTLASHDRREGARESSLPTAKPAKTDFN